MDLHNPTVIGTLTLEGGAVIASNEIAQGNSSVVVTDTGSDGNITFTADGASVAVITDVGMDISKHIAVGNNASIDWGIGVPYGLLINAGETFDSTFTGAAYGINVSINNEANDVAVVSIGVSATVQNNTSVLHATVQGGNFFANVTADNAVVIDVIGVMGAASAPADNIAITNMYGGRFETGTGFSMSGAVITNMIGGQFQILNAGSGDVSITDGYGVLIETPGFNPSGTTTNLYGVYIEDQSTVGFTNDFNLYSAGANSENFFEGNVTPGQITAGVAAFDIKTSGDEDGITINNDGSVELFYDNVKVAETTAAGITGAVWG